MSNFFSSNSENVIYNKEYRCPKCSLIPFIKIFIQENQLFISTKCTNNHNYSIPFDEMQTLSNPISNCICETCESNNIYYYCSNCYNFYCLSHGELHNLIQDHNIFFIKNFDSSCTEHNGIFVVGYCKNHNKNYCVRCEHFIENNKKFDEELKDEDINYYEKEMKKNENIINEIELIFNYYKKLFKDLENIIFTFRDNINKKINFMNEFIHFYKKKKMKLTLIIK